MTSIQDSDQRRETDPASKVPHITLMFWAVKIIATTVGETGGDALSMTLKLGYAISSIILLAFFFVTLTAQIASKRYRPFVYWLVVVATTTVGTTTSDYLDRTVGLGYVKSSFMLFCGVLLILYIWRRVVGRVEFENIATRKEEVFYWLTILVSNTLGTALGDFVATSAGLGFDGGALVFAGLIVVVAVAHFWLKKVPPSALFWAAYILTRPLGATLGDTLTKPYGEGGLELGRITSSLVIAAFMVMGIVLMSRSQQRRAVRSGEALLD
ncbi:COG4705 family protein [Paraburkholderia sediminicola]|uniref:COG4705 family protein n=1 Tax=Paraburkholderia sediminicola TaxID=458836 RepID=UPI0038B9300F